jgi:hypothetical protein
MIGGRTFAFLPFPGQGGAKLEPRPHPELAFLDVKEPDGDEEVHGWPGRHLPGTAGSARSPAHTPAGVMASSWWSSA